MGFLNAVLGLVLLGVLIAALVRVGNFVGRVVTAIYEEFSNTPPPPTRPLG